MSVPYEQWYVKPDEVKLNTYYQTLCQIEMTGENPEGEEKEKNESPSSSAVELLTPIEEGLKYCFTQHLKLFAPKSTKLTELHTLVPCFQWVEQVKGNGIYVGRAGVCGMVLRCLQSFEALQHHYPRAQSNICPRTAQPSGEMKQQKAFPLPDILPVDINLSLFVRQIITEALCHSPSSRFQQECGECSFLEGHLGLRYTVASSILALLEKEFIFSNNHDETQQQSNNEEGEKAAAAVCQELVSALFSTIQQMLEPKSTPAALRFPPKDCDFLYGRAGYLSALLHLEKFVLRKLESYYDEDGGKAKNLQGEEAKKEGSMDERTKTAESATEHRNKATPTNRRGYQHFRSAMDTCEAQVFPEEQRSPSSQPQAKKMKSEVVGNSISSHHCRVLRLLHNQWEQNMLEVVKEIWNEGKATHAAEYKNFSKNKTNDDGAVFPMRHLMWKWHDKMYCGAIHGICGVLYQLLHVPIPLLIKAVGDRQAPYILLESVEDCGKNLRCRSSSFSSQATSSKVEEAPSGSDHKKMNSSTNRKRQGGVNYQSSVGSESDKLIQLCHGATGFVFLFLAARQYATQHMGESHSQKADGTTTSHPGTIPSSSLTPSSSSWATLFLDLAFEAGEVIWERGCLTYSPGLCHGIGGNTYCHLALYRATQELQYLARAYYFVQYGLEQVITSSGEWGKGDRPFSLYEGVSGLMLGANDVCFCIFQLLSLHHHPGHEEGLSLYSPLLFGFQLS